MISCKGVLQQAQQLLMQHVNPHWEFTRVQLLTWTFDFHCFGALGVKPGARTLPHVHWQCPHPLLNRAAALLCPPALVLCLCSCRHKIFVTCVVTVVDNCLVQMLKGKGGLLHALHFRVGHRAMIKDAYFLCLVNEKSFWLIGMQGRPRAVMGTRVGEPSVLFHCFLALLLCHMCSGWPGAMITAIA